MTLEALIVAGSLAAIAGPAVQEGSAVEPAAQELAAQEPVPAPVLAPAPGEAQSAIDRGLRAYWQRRFSDAEVEFQRAREQDPQSPAAAYYLGYSIYKQVEFRRFDPEKQRAREMFARAFELDPTFRPTFVPSDR